MVAAHVEYVMSSQGSRRYIEIGQDGLKFVAEQESIMGNGPVPTTIDEIPLEKLPIENIKIDGISRIEAAHGDDGQILRMEFDTAEYEGGPQTEDDGDRDFFERLEDETGIKFKDGEFVFNDALSDKENFVQFVRFLFEEGHITKDDLPYQTKYARKAYLINTEPTDQDGDPMERTGEPVNGVYVPTYYGKDQKQGYMETLINDFVKGEHID